MKQKRIKAIFDRVFNNMPNPIFCYPMFYFQHGDFVCEVARTKQMNEMRWNNREFELHNPLEILEALFVDDGMYVTVLERKQGREFVHRTDLCTHIESKNEISAFVRTLK